MLSQAELGSAAHRAATRRRASLPRLAAAVLALTFALALAGSARAAASPDLDAAAAHTQLVSIEAKLPRAQTDADVLALRDEADQLMGQAQSFAAATAVQLADADQRLAQLGPPPAPPAHEDATLGRVRKLLQGQHDALDGQVKRARLIAVAAGQVADDAAERRRELFNQHLFQRGASPLTPAFWTDLARTLPPDFARLDDAAREEMAVARKAPEPRALLLLLVGLAVAAGLMGPVRLTLRRLVMRKVIEDIPPTPLRRSLFALGRVLINTLVPLAAASLLAIAGHWSGALSVRAGALAGWGVVAAGWASLVVGLGRALLSVEADSWRLAPIADPTARRLQALPWVIAGVTSAGLLLGSLNRVVGASLAATVAAHCATGLAYAMMAAASLVVLGLGRLGPEEPGPAKTPDKTPDKTPAKTPAKAPAKSSSDQARRSPGWTLVSVAAAAAIVLALGAILSGFAVFGAQLAAQIYWVGVLAGVSYILLSFVDDLCAVAFDEHGWAARSLAVVFGMRRSTVDPLGVVVSAVVRLLILAVAFDLVLSPFGQGAQGLLTPLTRAARPFQLGTVVISPAAVFGGLASLAIGVVLVRIVRGWLERRYLPATDWDAGLRNSVSTAVGYVGMALVIVWALASAGLGLERVALVASALSVGIGFGLQQIVQNFVSGLILLAERPIKVGDWISVGGQEGDVQHIRVRATEIRMFDRSTVIVPNSELVSKAVQNKTLGGARGRVELALSIADGARAGEARDVILAACRAEDDLLHDPEPRVFVDAVTPAGVALKGFAYVASARDAYRVRSQLYFAILAALAARGVALAGASQSLVLEPGPGLARVLSPGPQGPEADG